MEASQFQYGIIPPSERINILAVDDSDKTLAEVEDALLYLPSEQVVRVSAHLCTDPAKEDFLAAISKSEPFHVAILDCKVPPQPGGDKEYQGGPELIRWMKNQSRTGQAGLVYTVPSFILITNTVRNALGNTDLPLFKYDSSPECRERIANGDIPVFEKPREHEQWTDRHKSILRYIVSEMLKYGPHVQRQPFKIYAPSVAAGSSLTFP